MSKRNYYEVLGVSKSSTSSEIKKAYHKLAMVYHPDKNASDKDAEKKFKEINEAYDVLKDPEKKNLYDQVGHENFTSSGGGANFHKGFAGGGFHADVNDIFGDFFSDFMGGNNRSGKQSVQMRGADLKYNLTITLEDAFKGVNKDIGFATEIKCDTCNGNGSADKEPFINCNSCHGHGVNRIQQGFFALEQTCNTCSGSGKIIKNPCKKCHGSGRYNQQKNLRVNIPAGIENDTKIRLVGEGESGIRGGQSGDLYVFISIAPHNLYSVNGVNTKRRLNINFLQAILGAELMITNIDGENLQVKIPEGTQSGEIIKLKNKGMPKVRSTVRGDLDLQIQVQIPKKLNKTQRDLLENLAKEFGNTSEDDGTFFDKVKNLWS